MPPTARRVGDDGTEIDVPLEEVRVGDRLRVRPGGKVPVDGVVVEGSSAVDESPSRGEVRMSLTQPSDPSIRLVDDDDGITLWIDDIQVMQGWEAPLMWRSADLLTERGSDFLEIGLGLGLSALRIANSPGTRRHTVVEKYPEVIELFRGRNEIPDTLEIVNRDVFEFVQSIEPHSVDGILFDFDIPREMFDSDELFAGFLPKLLSALRPGGAFVPMFATLTPPPEVATTTRSAAQTLDKYLAHFDTVHIERHPYRTYASTNYMPAREGDAFIECFRKA